MKTLTLREKVRNWIAENWCEMMATDHIAKVVVRKWRRLGLSNQQIADMLGI